MTDLFTLENDEQLRGFVRNLDLKKVSKPQLESIAKALVGDLRPVHLYNSKAKLKNEIEHCILSIIRCHVLTHGRNTTSTTAINKIKSQLSELG